MIFTYRGVQYPEYLKQGNAMQHIAATAAYFCKGKGIDVGGGKWPLPAAELCVDSGKLNGKVDLAGADYLPGDDWDYIFSSHCLEHLPNPVATIEYWKTKLRVGGVLFLYLPHPDMVYWRPQNCRKHLHSWYPEQMADLLRDLGFAKVIHSERDLAWSFSVVGFKASDEEVVCA